MRPSLIAAVFLSLSLAPSQKPEQAIPPKQPEPLELKGDRLGETLEEFKLHHTEAQCEHYPAKNSIGFDLCAMWVGVTIADAPAKPNPDCSFHSKVSNCSEGMVATFKPELVSLIYAVNYGYRDQIVSALRKKYGTPSVDTTDSVIWRGTISTLWVRRTTKEEYGTSRPTVQVRLYLNGTAADRDI